MLTYLLFPRPGPYLGAGKIAFFLLGSLIVLAEGYSPRGLANWILVLLLYELALSQAKYLLNDFAGRRSDRAFRRGARNRFPQGGRGAAAVAAYGVVRALGGVAGLLLVTGAAGATAGALTILLQVLYEVIKLARASHRGLALFLVAAANYGVRTLAGIVAIEPSAFSSGLALLSFLWAAGAGALFLSIYWQRQGEYYLGGGRTSTEMLGRFKPGVLAIYRTDLGRAGGRQPGLPAILLAGLLVGSVTFAFVGPRHPGSGYAVTLSAALGLVACLAYALLNSEAAAPAFGVEGECDAA
ncbi:MAG TPA: hypothetical protein VND24_11085 [Steroidobacteraceae bacterium]|nr:hypothetical protein [Steroidobacteraceae bacterium]